MQLSSQSFGEGQPIPEEFAFCRPGAAGSRPPITLSTNRNPHLAWSGAPAETRSYVVLCVDPTVPSRPDDVNVEGREVPADLPRVDFAHWVLIDVPAAITELAAGSHSDGVTPRGKAPGPAVVGEQGVNDYTGWFAGDPEMAGTYGGYDGPAPPWNDSIVHRYVFEVLALDVARLEVARGAGLTLAAVRAAVAGHVLARATLTGTYTLNPRLRGP